MRPRQCVVAVLEQLHHVHEDQCTIPVRVWLPLLSCMCCMLLRHGHTVGKSSACILSCLCVAPHSSGGGEALLIDQEAEKTKFVVKQCTMLLLMVVAAVLVPSCSPCLGQLQGAVSPVICVARGSAAPGAGALPVSHGHCYCHAPAAHRHHQLSTVCETTAAGWVAHCGGEHRTGWWTGASMSGPMGVFAAFCTCNVSDTAACMMTSKFLFIGRVFLSPMLWWW